MIRVRDPKSVALVRSAGLQACLLIVLSIGVSAQRADAPIDLTGYWVSVVTEDWRWRMLTPPKGDASGVPLNIEGRKAADTWDPARDAATGQTCRAFGPPGLMRQPTRLHVTWQDDKTLRMDVDSGAQTRIFRFDAARAAAMQPKVPTLQGRSLAGWENGALKVVTTGMAGGYVRKNGVPYSAQAVLTEYFDLVPAQPNGDRWLVVSAILDDARYLTE